MPPSTTSRTSHWGPLIWRRGAGGRPPPGRARGADVIVVVPSLVDPARRAGPDLFACPRPARKEILVVRLCPVVASGVTTRADKDLAVAVVDLDGALRRGRASRVDGR